MLVVKPHGKSRVGSPEGRRELVPRGKEESSPRDVGEFTKENADAVLAHWISVIDKILRKPGLGKSIAPDHFRARQALGRAAWTHLGEKGILPRDGKERERLGKVWERKLHPYIRPGPGGASRGGSQSGQAGAAGGGPPRASGRGGGGGPPRASGRGGGGPGRDRESGPRAQTGQKTAPAPDRSGKGGHRPRAPAGQKLAGATFADLLSGEERQRLAGMLTAMREGRSDDKK